MDGEREEGGEAAAARRSEAVRLRKLIEGYRAHVDRLRRQREGFEARISILSSDLEAEDLAVSLPLLEAERDRLCGVLAQARLDALSRRGAIEVEQRGLEARLAEVDASIKRLEGSGHGQVR